MLVGILGELRPDMLRSLAFGYIDTPMDCYFGVIFIVLLVIVTTALRYFRI